MHIETFTAWDPEPGTDSLLGTVDDGDAGRSSLYAVHGSMRKLPDGGGCFGINVGPGEASVNGRNVGPGQFFSTATGPVIQADGLLVAIQLDEYLGTNLIGGPLEARGRLRYIDGCTDSLLIAPPVLGDPCLNLLHFPVGIDQTAHTHPSVRFGVVARGRGECVYEEDGREGVYALEPGVVFCIPRDCVHKFRTLRGEEMTVVAYHPDSDHGPQHDDHPMLNRTWVGGVKMDNDHFEADFIVGRGGLA